MEEFDLTERMITAAEFATHLGVIEDDILQWMRAGHIPYLDGPDGEPRARILEQHSVDGPLTSALTIYPMSQDADFRAEVARRRRELELQTLDRDDVDLDALADALGSRLEAVAPAVCHVAVERAMIWLRDADGAGGGIDVASAASWLESGSPAERVRDAAATVLERVQEELAEVTTDPWPRSGVGELPAPRAQFASNGAMVRLLYGDPVDPVLELEPLPVSEVLPTDRP